MCLGHTAATPWQGLDLLERPSHWKLRTDRIIKYTYIFKRRRARRKKYNPLLYTAALPGPTYLTSFVRRFWPPPPPPPFPPYASLTSSSPLFFFLILFTSLEANHITHCYFVMIVRVDRDSSVGIATRCEMDGPGIESRWGGEIFSTRPNRPWDLTSLLYNGYRVSFPGVKRPGRGVDHPPSSSAEDKERVKLYLYSPSGPSWPVPGWTLPLPLPLFFYVIRRI
jgi:hypothetical protein